VIKKLKTGWKVLRGHFWASLVVDVVLIGCVFLLVSMWQTRNLPDDEHTPELELAWLDDMGADSVFVPGKVGVVFFFCPRGFLLRKSKD
jgi:hypothetical protein